MASSLRFLHSATRTNALRQLAPAVHQTRSAMRFKSSAAVASSPVLSSLPSACKQLFDAKAQKGMSFTDVGKAIGKDELWTAALFYGQAKPSAEVLAKLSEVLGVSLQSLTDSLGEHWWPTRGLGPNPPTDPVIYRLHEGVQVYGFPIKTLIHEKFGDGIMSLIDCKVTVDREAHKEGDRVVLKFDGKFLPYSKW